MTPRGARSFLRGDELAFFQDPGFEPALDEPFHCRIGRQLFQERRMVDVESRWGACAGLAASRFPHRSPPNRTDPFQSIRLSQLALTKTAVRCASFLRRLLGSSTPRTPPLAPPTLPPFPLCVAFPHSEYYGGSAPRSFFGALTT